jgi:DNA-directed RNA polymerase subunit beta'
MTQGLSRVEELFEARSPKAEAEISDIDGIVEIEQTDAALIVRVRGEELLSDEYYFEDEFEVCVKVGQEIKAKQILARNTKEKQKVLSKFVGIVHKIDANCITIKDAEPRVFEYEFPVGKTFLVKDGERVKK